MQNTKSLPISLCALIFLLSGCVGFHEKLNPEQENLAMKKGNKTLIIHGYSILNKKAKPCSDLAKHAMLVPDDLYYMKYIDYLDKTERSSFKDDLPKEAKEAVHYADWQENCIYHFPQLPAGRWRILINMRYYESKPVIVSTGMGTPLSNTHIGDTHYVWAPITIDNQDNIVKKQLIFKPMENKNYPAFHFSLKGGIPIDQGILLDWDENRTDKTSIDN